MKIIIKRGHIAHEDDRRTIQELYNGDFTARQIKILFVKTRSVLGNHYHPYSQFFFILKGRASYEFYDMITNEKKSVKMKRGDYVQIGPNIAHAALMNKGTITLEGNEQPFDPSKDIKYDLL